MRARIIGGHKITDKPLLSDQKPNEAGWRRKQQMGQAAHIG
jgi:hypothetical protein